MTGSSIFFDTAPLIYLLENHPTFTVPVARFVTEAVRQETVFLTSVLTYSEYAVGPERLGRQHLIADLDAFLARFEVTVATVSLPSAVTAYKLRAKYAFLRGMDALQLATALELNATVFFTNDRKLQAVQELRVVLVTDL